MLFSRHLDLAPARRISPWRRMAIGTWRTAKDPSVYGFLELDCSHALPYLEHVAKAAVPGGGEGARAKATITHFVGAAVARAFAARPEINAVLRFGRVYPRRGVTLFFQVATDKAGTDLSGVTVADAATKSVADLARDMAAKVDRVRFGGDPSYRKMKGLFGLVPGFAAGWLLDVAGFLQFALNIWSPLFGTPKDPLGSVMITNVGMLGIDRALAPLVPYSRVPMVIAVGQVRDRVVAVAGHAVVRPVVVLGITFDHRLIDGVHAAELATAVERAFADPEAVLGG